MSDNAFLPYFPAVLTAIIAAAAAYLTYLQHKTNALRLKHELFERRFQVYDSFTKFLGGIMREGKTSPGDCLTLVRETNHAVFLFGPEIPEYLGQSLRRASISRNRIES